MKNFVIKRFVQMFFVFILVSILSFSIIYFAPGDPLYMYMTPTASNYKLSDEQMDAMRKDLGLEGNVVQQYFNWAKKTVSGDWGISVANHQSVKQQVLGRLPNTVGLMGSALVLAILLAIPLGLLAGLYKNKWIDNLISSISYLGISLPAFWFGMMLIILFSLNLKWFPSSGMRSIGSTSFSDVLWHSVLPVVVLSVNNMATFVRYIRSNTINQLEEDYVMTAISKGISKKRILGKHVLKNCLLPVITMVGMSFGTLVTGSFIVESIFGWPGLGTLGMEAINNRDYPLIMGITMLSCTILLLGNFLADILYGFADPRIKQRKENLNA